MYGIVSSRHSYVKSMESTYRVITLVKKATMLNNLDLATDKEGNGLIAEESRPSWAALGGINVEETSINNVEIG